MAPDGAVAQCPAASFIALTRVHKLGVVDVAIRLVEVAIAVPIVAVPHVEPAQVGIDLGRGFAGGDLRVVPAIERIDQELPDANGIPGSWIAVVIVTGYTWE